MSHGYVEEHWKETTVLVNVLRDLTSQSANFFLVSRVQHVPGYTLPVAAIGAIGLLEHVTCPCLLSALGDHKIHLQQSA